MNIFKLVYSRFQQQILHAAIPFLPYKSPTILHATIEVSGYLWKRGIKSVLIVTDKSIHGLGLIGPLKEKLERDGIRYTVYDETVPNPTIVNVEDALKLYKESNCEAIVGFGGGSALDCSKIVAARVARPGKPVMKMKGVFKVLKKGPLLVAVPTTAGTGSETTATALITNSQTHFKFTINDLKLIPDVAVLDPKVTEGLPKSITSTTGMDAMTHAVEAYIGMSTTKATRQDALDAVKLISENLLYAYNDGHNMTARANMLMGSFLAGRSFAKSYVGYCHAVAHSLGGEYGTAHGLANAVLLPHILRGYGSSIYKKMKPLAISAGVASNDTPDKEACENFISFIEDLNEKMNIPKTLPELRKEDISTLSTKAEKEANPFYPVPKMFTREELEKFYYDVYDKSKDGMFSEQLLKQ